MIDKQYGYGSNGQSSTDALLFFRKPSMRYSKWSKEDKWRKKKKGWHRENTRRTVGEKRAETLKDPRKTSTVAKFVRSIVECFGGRELSDGPRGFRPRAGVSLFVFFFFLKYCRGICLKHTRPTKKSITARRSFGVLFSCAAAAVYTTVRQFDSVIYRPTISQNERVSEENVRFDEFSRTAVHVNTGRARP